MSYDYHRLGPFDGDIEDAPNHADITRPNPYGDRGDESIGEIVRFADKTGRKVGRYMVILDGVKGDKTFTVSRHLSPRQALMDARWHVETMLTHRAYTGRWGSH